MSKFTFPDAQSRRNVLRQNKPGPKIPSLCRHRATDQAFVVLNRKTVYLGRYGLEQTTQRYHRVVAEWLANNRQMKIEPHQITVKELLARFFLHAQKHYVKANGKKSSELGNFQTVMRSVKKLYADTLAKDFGPMALRVIREQMVLSGWCRKSINRMVGRIKGIFRWGTEQELIPGSVYHSLSALSGLRRDYTEAPESQPVRPVPMELVEAVKRIAGKQVRAIIELQLLTAARPGELCIMRPCDIDRSGRIWVYRPSDHKNSYREMERLIYIGPQAQNILANFLLRPPQEYCFSPEEATRQYYERRHAKRTTPLHYGNAPRENRYEYAIRRPGDHYTVNVYRRAITRACDLAFPLPPNLRPRTVEGLKRLETIKEWQERLTDQEKADIQNWRKAHRWHPHQLRHNAATYLRKEFGLDTARIILGHHSPAVTLIYAEADQKKALEVMEKVG